MANLETTILRNLISNDQYTRTVIPFLKPEYFDAEHRQIFNQIANFVAKFNKLPTSEALLIEMSSSSTSADAMGIAQTLKQEESTDVDWLVDKTEQWCQERAVFLAVMKSIEIIDGKHTDVSNGAIPDLLKDALGVCFDARVGHDYIDNFAERYDFYNRKETRTTFDLEYFNKITKGGVPNKTLNIILAGTGVGKSLFMCHCAAANLTRGKNVLYITMEMAEERIAERIDANLMNVQLDQIANLGIKMFENKVSQIAKKTQGKLIIKEYPTGAAHVGHFRALLNELKLKRKFTPDVIYIDYLNICASSRMKGLSGSVNTYSLIKSIAEELRGLAVEFNVPVFSATQTTRSGYSNTDVGLEDTSESFGLPATADLMFALISNDELAELNQIMVKQLKNRYNDPNLHKRFVIGVDRSRMKLYDVEEEAQKDLVTNQVSSNNNNQKDFSGFKT
ncbi:MAG: DNA primase [Muricauda sp. TMED12]|nr:MAG: DNA primase [Muricauda sp. TMED12]